MSQTSTRNFQLSPKKRALLEVLLQKEDLNTSLSPRISRKKAGDAIPLSFSQQRLWFLDQLEPGNSAYNMPASHRLTGPLNVTALEQSLNEIVRRHETLRTTFATKDDQPVQVIAPSLTLPLPVIDLSDLPEAEQTSRAKQLASEAREHIFDLPHGPLLHANLLRLGAEEHILILVMHHIVSDGWSMDILARELSALYLAFSKGEPSPLPELPIQYADFAVWQREWLQGETLARQLDYWKQQLSDSPPVLELPTDRPRSPVLTHRGASQALLLSQNLAQSLKVLSQQEGTTLFMTLLTAFNILLHRYTGQDDIIVGTPIAGRNRAEIEGLIGFFLNNLVIRTDHSGKPTFREMLDRVRQVALEAYAHQDLPFEKLIEELQVERKLSRTPLFQVFFNMLTLENNELELPGLVVERLSFAKVGAKFDLTLYVSERNGGISLRLVYNTDLFDRERMAEMLAQYKLLLLQIVENPDEKIARSSMVTATAEGHLPNPVQALDLEWVGAVQTRFSQQARQVPEHPAVVDRQETWTYQELDARSNQLANYLRANGIQSQDLVAIYGHRSASLVWALLGVLKAGAAFVILDPAYPVLRLIDYLRLARPQGWLQLEAAGEVPEALAESVVTLACRCRLELPQNATTAARGLLRDHSVDAPQVAVGPDDLAYVAFTSGSTGKPKGILGEHRPLAHFLQWHSQIFGLNGSDRFSMLSGLSHDPLLRDIFTPLWLGATLSIPDPEDIEVPGRLAEGMKQQAISIAHLTPAMEQLLTETTTGTTASNGQPVVLTTLRYAFFGGDVLTRRHVSRFRKLAPSATCVNFYGATETPQAMGYTIVPDQADTDDDGGPVRLKEIIPLGKGIKDVQLLVLNGCQQLAGIGEVGEIHVRSPYLARGYLNDETLTQDRFIVNPFTKTSGDRLYKTGDLGRYLPDGNVEFLGRNDNQVKIRGFRIELGEIEAVLDHHPAVQKNVVSVREDTPGDKRLVAYVVPEQEQAPTTSALRSFLHQKLPMHMVPTAFVMLNAIPLTPNGKVDRRSLPVLDALRPELEESFVVPRTPMEAHLAAIWQDVLGVEQVGVYDNFFDVGGHSLLSIQVIARVEKQWGLRLHPRDLMFQTLGQLAATCEERLPLPPPTDSTHFTERAWSALKSLVFRRQNDRY